MEKQNKKSLTPEQLLATIGTAYVEVLAGVRRPEQLARWLTDKAYFDLCEKAKTAARARQVTGDKNRPHVTLKTSRTFLTEANGYQGVVLVKISGATKALSIRAKQIHSRFRVTEMELI
jgi:hypothetical protein